MSVKDNLWLKRKIDLFKSNVSIISLIFYILGYVYLNRYYEQYNITIEKYIDLLDILFITINYLFFILLVYVFVEVIIYVLAFINLSIIFRYFITKKIRKRLGTSNRVFRYIDFAHNNYVFTHIKLTSLILFILCALLLLKYTDETLIILTLFFPFLTLKIFQILPNNKNEFKTKAYQILLLIFIVILIFCFGIWGYVDANLNKEENQISKIEFKEQGILYTTQSDSLNYIGETNKYIFLYNKNDRNTLIFNKENISQLKVKDITLSKKEKELKKQKEKQELNIRKKQIDEMMKNYQNGK